MIIVVDFEFYGSRFNMLLKSLEHFLLLLLQCSCFLDLLFVRIHLH